MRLALLLAASLAVAACASSDLAPTSQIPAFGSAEDVPREYVVIGYVTPDARSGRVRYGTADERLEQAKRLAYQLDADAVLVVSNADAIRDAAIEDFVRRGGSRGSAVTVRRTQYLAIRYVNA